MAALDARFGMLPLWLAAFAALALVIGWETDWGRHVTPLPETPPPKAASVNVALLPDYALDGGAEARRETVERPAFIPTRRPPPPPPTATEAAKPRLQRGQFVLTGTAVVDSQAIAFLREASTGKPRTVRKGDTINGLTVTEIAADRVMLALGDETEGLALKVAPGPRTTIQPPQPGQPPVAGVPGQPPGVPGQPPVVAVPGQPAAVPQPDVNAQSLLERRRAARAAQAAAEAAARANAQGAAPAQGQAAPAPAGGDASWADVYRRMQQPRR